MSSRIWTEDQEKAIKVSGKNILVSAAAGSGKTAALVERVIRKITDREKAVDIDKLLIVTFTNAAASEMKERIAKVLSDLIDKNPSDLNLVRQRSILKRASICTIHSFCLSVVRENFYRLGICPNFKVADENEISILQEKAIEKVFARFYDEGKEDFFKVVELFCSEKDDFALAEIIKKIYKFTVSCPFPLNWIDEKRKMYENEVNMSETPWGKILIKYAIDSICTCEYLISNALDLLEKRQHLKDFYLNSLLSEFAFFENLKEILEEKLWDKFLKKLNEFKRPRKGRIPDKYKDDSSILLIDSTRENTKKIIEKLKKYFVFDEERCKKDIKELSLVFNTLFKLTEEFISEISKLKEEKNIVEFSDLEHFMVKLLTKKGDNFNLEKSEIADEISKNYEEILVDEYQDTNEIQDLIFKMLSQNEQNLFMVGDVKQSIYGFRQARPDIFLKKKEKYKFSIEGEGPCKIVLGKNFRSNEKIIDTVNFIFEKIMSKELSGLEYGKEEALTFGRNLDKTEERNNLDSCAVSIEILESLNEENSEKAEALRISEIISKMIKQGYKIKENGKDRRVTYKDFCILLRSANKYAKVYADVLSENSIPVWSDSAGKFFGTTEISFILSLLRIIDNPVQDIPLISVLISPVFGFTTADIARIRIKKKSTSLYLAIKSMAEEKDFRCKEFIEKLDLYRRISSTLPVERFINFLYQDTGYTSMVLSMTNGDLRLANLRLLAEYAGKYDSTAYKGLSGFIRFIDKLEEKKGDLAPASTISEVSNVVRIMSIHRSKGLEFNICILARCFGRFNKEKGDILLHSDLGLAVFLKDETYSVKYPNFIRSAISLELEKEEISEEIRVLYVALTRAKEKIIFLFSVKDIQKNLENSLIFSLKNKRIHPYFLRSSQSFGHWILSCLVFSSESDKLFNFIGIENPGICDKIPVNWEINTVKSTKEEEKKCQKEIETDEIIDFSNEIVKRFEFDYPYAGLNMVSSKVSASKLAHESSWQDYIAVSKPNFILEDSTTPQEKGTAIHEFLHFADYFLALEDFDTHLESLVKKGFLTQRQAGLVDKKSIFRFLKSEIGQRIMKSKKVLREYRFTVGVSAYEIDNKSYDEKIDESKDKIIIQGAMDCVFQENDEFVILDYKTDKTEDMKILKNRYEKQLHVYKYAFEILNGRKVKQLLLYSISTGEWIEVYRF